MKSFTSRRFREMHALLPDSVRLQAVAAYRLFKRDPAHPGLNFKKVVDSDNLYSVRIGRGALGRMDGSEIVWFWIGPHGEYDKLV